MLLIPILLFLLVQWSRGLTLESLASYQFGIDGLSIVGQRIIAENNSGRKACFHCSAYIRVFFGMMPKMIQGAEKVIGRKNVISIEDHWTSLH